MTTAIPLTLHLLVLIGVYELAAGIAGRTPFVLAHPVEANAVFVRMPPETHARLNALGWACYAFDDGSVRFVCSWATQEAAVDELIEAVVSLG